MIFSRTDHRDGNIRQGQTWHPQDHQREGNLASERAIYPPTLTPFYLPVQVAVKVLDKDKLVDSADKKRLQREIAILRKIRHPHIIQLYEVAIKYSFPSLPKPHPLPSPTRSSRHLVSCFSSWNTLQTVSSLIISSSELGRINSPTFPLTSSLP